MKNALKQSILFVLIIVFSFFFGFVFDKICISVENGTHTADTAYADIIAEYSEIYNVDSAWVYAIIKTETNFSNVVESRDGKVGVMALSPEIFDYIKNEIMVLPDTDSGLIFNPETNIEYGVAYLAFLKEKYASDKMTLCAYLVGEETLDAWLENQDSAQNGMILKTIPDKKTEKTVNHIMRHYKLYSRVLSQK